MTHGGTVCAVLLIHQKNIGLCCSSLATFFISFHFKNIIKTILSTISSLVFQHIACQYVEVNVRSLMQIWK